MCAPTVLGATVSWTGAGDGATWQDAHNWSGNVLPVRTNDVDLRGWTDLSIISTGSVSIASIQSDAALVLTNGSLVVNRGDSVLSGALTVARSTLSASGLDPSAPEFSPTLTVSGPVTLQSGRITAVNAMVNVHGLTGLEVEDLVELSAEGPRGVLKLSQLSRAHTASDTGRLDIGAWRGGEVNLAGLTELSGIFTIEVMGPDSTIDLPALERTISTGHEQAWAGSRLAVSGGATLEFPNLREVVADDRLSFDSRGERSALRFGAPIALERFDGGMNSISLSAGSGGYLGLKGTGLFQGVLSWQAVGAGSVVDLSEWSGHRDLIHLHLAAFNGGLIIGPCADELIFDTPALLQAVGAGSRIDLSCVTRLVLNQRPSEEAGSSLAQSRLAITGGGQVDLVNMVRLEGTIDLQVEGLASRIEWPALEVIRATGSPEFPWIHRITCGNGAVLDFPRLREVITDQALQFMAVGAGSMLTLGHPTTLDRVDGGTKGMGLFATSGGVVRLSGPGLFQGALNVVASGAASVVDLSDWEGQLDLLGLSLSADSGGLVRGPCAEAFLLDAPLSLRASGTHSVIDLGCVTHLGGGADSAVGMFAENGGLISVPALQSIASDRTTISSTGPGSEVELSELTSLIVRQPFGGRLDVESGGLITLGTDGMVTANSSLRTNGYFGPPVWEVGAFSLLGEPGRSYWIEVRDSTSPEADWALFGRVALTTAVRPLGSMPLPYLMYRVREFSADPPVLELRRIVGPSHQIVLFGVPTNSYVLESAASLDAPPGGWSTDATVTLRNSFHFFPLVSADEPARFFRVKVD